MELQNQLKEWKEYRDGIDVVLRAWDTYRRSEEARMHMQQYNSELALSRDEFLRLDEEIKRARDNMQLWQEKEAALMPANFSPDSPFGTYGQDIEDLIQQGAKWEQLRRECEEGDAYIRKVREQLEFSRTLHSAWQKTSIGLMENVWQVVCAPQKNNFYIGKTANLQRLPMRCRRRTLKGHPYLTLVKKN